MVPSSVEGSAIQKEIKFKSENYLPGDLKWLMVDHRSGILPEVPTSSDKILGEGVERVEWEGVCVCVCVW
jgi:hypothetical protein